MRTYEQADLITDSLKKHTALWDLAGLFSSLTSDLVTGSQNFEREMFLVAGLPGQEKETCNHDKILESQEGAQTTSWDDRFKSIRTLLLHSGGVDKCEVYFLKELMAWNVHPLAASGRFG